MGQAAKKFVQAIQNKKVILLIGIAAAVVAVILCVSFFAGGDREDGFEYLIGLSQPNLSDNAQKELYNDIVTRCEKFPGAHLVSYDAGYSSAKQRSDIERLLEIGVDAMIVATNNPEEIVDSITRAYDSGVTVIIVGYAPMNGKYSSRIFSDNQKIAGMVGDYVSRVSGGEPCAVLEIQGEPKTHISQDLKNGFLQSVEGHPNILKEYVMTGYWSQVSTQERMEESLFFEKEPGIDVIFAHNDSMAIAAAMVAAAHGKDPVIVGVGGYRVKNSDLEAIRGGAIDATVYCPTGGAEAVDIVMDSFAGKEIPETVELWPELVTKENIESFEQISEVPND